jgi:hypothetical protein
MAMKIQDVVFWVMKLCSDVVDTSVSDAASIFRVKTMSLGKRTKIYKESLFLFASTTPTCTPCSDPVWYTTSPLGGPEKGHHPSMSLLARTEFFPPL